MEDICRLLDEANRIMHDELIAQLENVLVTDSEECSSAVKVSKTFSDSANRETSFLLIRVPSRVLDALKSLT